MPATQAVLIVQDEPSIRELFSEWLRGAGYSASGFARRRSYFDAPWLQQGRPDCPGLMMPVMGGERFLAAIRGTPEEAIPVVVTTCLQEIPAIVRTSRITFLKKPLDRLQLLQVVRKWTEA